MCARDTHMAGSQEMVSIAVISAGGVNWMGQTLQNPQCLLTHRGRCKCCQSCMLAHLSLSIIVSGGL